MRIELNIDESELVWQAQEIFVPVKVACQAAMANRLASIVHNNFGMDGEDRPTLWPSLTAKYAREYHSGVRTPTLQLTGDLQESIELDEAIPEASSVFTNNPYAKAHQEGDGPLPARPFFPIVANELTEYSKDQCLVACGNQLERSLK